MKRLLTPLAVGILVFVALTSVALAWPDHATVRGSLSNGGNILFKFKQHKLVLLRGHSPTRKTDRCFDVLKGETVFDIPNDDPLGNKHFRIRVEQTVTHHGKVVRFLTLVVSGWLNQSLTRGHGGLRLKVVDGRGKCESGPLTWKVPRS